MEESKTENEREGARERVLICKEACSGRCDCDSRHDLFQDHTPFLRGGLAMSAAEVWLAEDQCVAHGPCFFCPFFLIDLFFVGVSF